MAFLLRLKTTHILPTPSRSLLHHHHRLLSISNSGADNLLRLRTFHTFTTPSQLHHHRLFSTSNSGAGDDEPNTNHPFLFCQRSIPTLTNPSPSLLHHLRLLSTSDSDHPSPSLVKKVREAFKQLSETEAFLEPFISEIHSTLPSPSSPSPATYSIPYDPSRNSPNSDLQNELQRESSNPTSSTFSSLDEKLEHLKVTALSLNQRQETDRQRLSELFESKYNLCHEIEEISKLPLETRDIRGNHCIDTVIAKLTRLNEMIVEISELAQELTNSRLTSLYKICVNLYKIREDWPQHEELWTELNYRLKVFQVKEEKGFQLHSEDTNIQLDYFQNRITNLFRIRDNKEE